MESAAWAHFQRRSLAGKHSNMTASQVYIGCITVILLFPSPSQLVDMPLVFPFIWNVYTWAVIRLSLEIREGPGVEGPDAHIPRCQHVV